MPNRARKSRAASALGLALVFSCKDPVAAKRDDSLTFAKDVAPLIYARCSPCHRPEQSAPFSLLSFEDVRDRADQIVEVTQSGFMPPWKPVAGYGRFANDRSLSGKQREMLKRWVEQGAKPGDLSAAPKPPVWPEGWRKGPPDLVLEMAEPYELSPQGLDDFRNFVVPVPLEKLAYVRAWEFRPGNDLAVHHALLKVDKLRVARELDRKSEGPGFPGMDLEVELESPDGFFLVWVPGAMPDEYPSGLAWSLSPGSDLVFNLHMQPTGKKEIIQSKVGLYFTDTPPTKRLLQVRLGDVPIDIPAGSKDYKISDELELPVDVDLLSVFPHAHYLGKTFRTVATLPDGRKEWLLRIDDWDFNWQDRYRYESPVTLPAGTKISLEIGYDNTTDNPRNPSSPPVRVRHGSSSKDEMGSVSFEALPKNQADLPKLYEQRYRRQLRFSQRPETLYNLGTALMLEKKFEEAEKFLHAAIDARETSHAHHNLANVLMELGRFDESEKAFRKALKLSPDSSRTQVGLGLLAMRQSKLKEAKSHFQRALELNPFERSAYEALGTILTQEGALADAKALLSSALERKVESAEIHIQLGSILMRAGEAAKALPHLERATQLEPSSADAHARLGMALASGGQMPRARTELEKAVQLAPENVGARYNLGEVLRVFHACEQAVPEYRRAIELEPSFAEAHNGLGVCLARSGDLAGARGHFEKALEIEPALQDAKDNLRRLDSR